MDMKIRTNKDFCPVCNQEWDLCECEQEFNENDLLKKDNNETI